MIKVGALLWACGWLPSHCVFTWLFLSAGHQRALVSGPLPTRTSVISGQRVTVGTLCPGTIHMGT